jgi:SAM-dependent methyltransferase
VKLYDDDLAPWWPLVSARDEYADEAREYIRLLEGAARQPLRRVLELGSGGGNNASYLKARYQLTLVDPSPGMREVSRALNPECEHLHGDMRTVRLHRTFDAVFVHDAIAYMATLADLRAAMETVAVHLRPGGVALLAPDATAETFRPDQEVGGGDEPGGRSLRYLMWTLPLPPGATAGDVHFAFLLRERDGTVRAVHDVHHEGVFPRATWLTLLGEVGLDGRLDARHIPEGDYDTFVAVKR